MRRRHIGICKAIHEALLQFTMHLHQFIYKQHKERKQHMLTSKQRANLRKQANSIDTIFQVGKDGVGENLIQQLLDALEARELIKIRVLENALMTPREASDIVCEATGADPVQVIGTRFVIYKKSEKNPRIVID